MIDKGPSGTFRIIHYIYLLMIAGISLVVFIFLSDQLYSSFSNSPLYKNNDSIKQVERFYNIGIMFDDYSVLIYVFLNLAIIFISLGIPADRDTAIFLILVMLIIYSILYLGYDIYIKVIKEIQNKTTTLPLKNSLLLPELMKLLPIISFIVSSILIYSRAIGSESGGKL